MTNWLVCVRSVFICLYFAAVLEIAKCDFLQIINDYRGKLHDLINSRLRENSRKLKNLLSMANYEHVCIYYLSRYDNRAIFFVIQITHGSALFSRDLFIAGKNRSNGGRKE